MTLNNKEVEEISERRSLFDSDDKCEQEAQKAEETLKKNKVDEIPG